MSSSSRRTWVTRCRCPRFRPCPPIVRSIAGAACVSSSRSSASASIGDELFDHDLVRAERLPGTGAIGGRELLDLLLRVRSGRALAEEPAGLRVERLAVHGAGDRRAGVVDRRVELGTERLEAHRALFAATLARRLEAEHRRGHGDVERLGCSAHRDAHRRVDSIGEGCREAPRLVPDDEGARCGEIHLVVGLAFTDPGAQPPSPGTAELGERR